MGTSRIICDRFDTCPQAGFCPMAFFEHRAVEKTRYAHKCSEGDVWVIFTDRVFSGGEELDLPRFDLAKATAAKADSKTKLRTLTTYYPGEDDHD